MNNKHTLIIAHGAGSPMDSDWLNDLVVKFELRGVRVIRFEFPYMHQRRIDGKRRPPNRLPILLDSYKDIIAQQSGTVFIAGKSLGGRIATMIADACDNVVGVIAYGYPFHPPAKPENLRTEHLKTLTKPCLIVQGENDIFGKKDEWQGFGIAKHINIFPMPMANHDLKPLKKSGLSLNGTLQIAVDETIEFMSAHFMDAHND